MDEAANIEELYERLQCALRCLFRSPVLDVSSGYRVYRASALRQLPFENDGYAFQWEIVLLALAKRMPVIEVPITFTRRRQGQSKLYLGETPGSYFPLLASHLFRGNRS